MLRKTHHVNIALAVISPLTAMAAAAVFADDVFLKLDGIPGESTDARHASEIRVRSYTQSFSRSDAQAGGGQVVGKVNCGVVTVTKDIDKASPSLSDAVTSGRQLANATIAFRRPDARDDYYTIGLSGVQIVGVNQTHETNAKRMIEQLQIAPTKFQFTYRPQNQDGSMGPPVTTNYDCAANRRY